MLKYNDILYLKKSLVIVNILFALILIFVLCMVYSAFFSIFVAVPYVPTKNKLIDILLKTAKIRIGFKIYDLGCGDGRMLFRAEKLYKTKCIGYELSLIPYILAHIKKNLFSYKSQIYFKDFFKADISKADVIFLYLTPSALAKLAKKLKKECKKGAKIISHTFHIEGMKPKTIIARNPIQKTPVIYIYKI